VHGAATTGGTGYIVGATLLCTFWFVLFVVSFFIDD
jgi:hypothetical protein